MAESTHESQIISPSTIFILSGTLMGMTITQVVGQDFSPYLIAAGLSGFMAFIVLDLAATRRAQVALRTEQKQMEQRLDKHMTSLTGMGLSLEEGALSLSQKSDGNAAKHAVQNDASVATV